MNVLIPMAGFGARFLSHGFKEPKPFIPIRKLNNQPMIRAVIENLNFSGKHYLLVKKELQEKLWGILFDLTQEKDIRLIPVDHATEGPACTCLIARRFIDNDEELLITNCDQIIGDWCLERLLNFCRKRKADGAIGTFFSNSIKNSYVRLGNCGEVIEVREKEVISNFATNGIHYWREGSLFVRSAQEMISRNDRVRNEFYVGPTYNYLIKEDLKVLFYHFNEHYPIGTPEDLEKYESNRY